MAKSNCTWTRTDSGFSFWSTQGSLTDELRESFRQADIVLVPEPGFGDYTGPLFPVNTGEFFRYLREKAPAGVKVELAVEDSDYK